MARSPQELQTVLSSIPDVEAAYMQPPSNVKLPEPYLVYEIDDDFVAHADNVAFVSFNRYSVTLVTRAPDDPIFERLRALPHTKFNRHFVSAGLHHYVFQLYF